MNILVLNGSPKGTRSNSMRLTEAFLEGLQEAAPSAEVEICHVRELDIKPCKGCFGCWNKTPGKCVLADDMTGLLEKKIRADIVIWSFPLYFFGVPGPLKNLIDRQLPLSLPFMTERADGMGSGSHPSRYDLSRQKNLIISTCGFYSAEGNYDSVRLMFDHFCGKGNYDAILCGQGELFRVKELSQRTDEYLAVCKQAGKEYAGGAISQETKAMLAQLLYPKDTFEAMADASWGVSKSSGEKEPESLSFTRQMAALYNCGSYDGMDRVLEMHYTDLDETYQILLGKDGSKVFPEPQLPYTTRVETPYSVWQQIARGEMRGDAALMEQKYRVKGDFSLMIDWDRYFGSGTQKEQPKPEEKNQKRPAQLWAMLLPWMALWIAVAVEARIGGLVALGVTALLPILLLSHETTIYDQLTAAIVTLLSALALFTGRGTLSICLGYLAFGLLWLLSCLTKEPLCAAYVKYGYGGEDALNNPIFLRTNYILAAGWGVLYLLISIWTPLLLHRGLDAWTQLINNGLTVFMGIFTAWFQKWYPAWVASGRRKRKKDSF